MLWKKQMRAEREKRAIIAESEGAKQAKINVAEGDKQALIKNSEGKCRKELMKQPDELPRLNNLQRQLPTV